VGDVDCAVVGCGPAGAAAAITLAQAGRRVLVIERRSDRNLVSPPLLGERLPAAARPVLQRLGAWPAFCAAGHPPCPGIASDWGADGNSTALTDPYGHGWHLDRPQFDRDLRRCAVEAGAALCHGELVDVVTSTCGVRLRWSDGRAVREATARWMIEATGRRRRVARCLGGRTEQVDRLIGVAAHVADADGTGPARVAAAPEGWWYSTAVPAGGRVIVYFTDADLPAARCARRPGGLAELASDAPGLTDIAPLLTHATAYPVAAGTTWLVRPGGYRWSAVGDAALTIDPLSGRGVLMALVGGVRAAAAIVAGNPDYERWLTGARVRLRLQQRAVYTCEWRWPNHPFWSRRRFRRSEPRCQAAPLLTRPVGPVVPSETVRTCTTVSASATSVSIDSADCSCENLRCTERADCPRAEGGC
jgi:flavin-dependent dehydrogenase